MLTNLIKVDPKMVFQTCLENGYKVKRFEKRMGIIQKCNTESMKFKRNKTAIKQPHSLIFLNQKNNLMQQLLQN